MLKLPALTEHFREQLVLLLSQYLKDFSKKNISKLNLGISSTLLLENLEIREDLLLMNSLPLVINEGKISKIKISIPSLFKNISMRMDVENVEIHVRFLVEQRNFDDMNQRVYKKDEGHQSKSIWAESFKKKKLRDWENKTKKHFKSLAPPNWAKKNIDNILKNMILSIKNITFYYESFSLLNMPSIAKINVQEINIHSTDENWFPAFSSEMKKLHRQILVTGLSVTLNINKNYQQDAKNEKFQKEFLTKKSETGRQSPSQTNSESGTNQDHDFVLEKEYHRLRKYDTYILYPLDVTIKSKQELDLSRDFSFVPQKSIAVEIKEPLIFMLNKLHMQYLGSLNEHIGMVNKVARNIHLRPSESPLENPFAWWVYAFNAIIEERKTIKSLAASTGNLVKMRRYIELYKREQSIIHVPWLARTSPKEKAMLKSLEDQLPLQSLLNYREWAFIEIRIEAKRYSASNQGIQRIKPLVDIWCDAVNNDRAFEKTPHTELSSIKLNSREQADLYEILALDKSKVLESYLKGQNSDPKDIILEVKVDIMSLYVLITEKKGESPNIAIDKERYQVNSVKDWWLQDKVESSINHDPLIKTYPQVEIVVDKNKPTPQKDRQIGSHHQLIDSNKPQSQQKFLVDELDEIDLNISSKSESYIEHLRDIARDQPEVFIDEEKPSNKPGEKHANPGDGMEENSHTPWCDQNLLLFIELIGCSIAIRKYKSGRLVTEKPVEMKSIMISTALNLSKAIRDRDMKNQLTKQPFDFLLKLDEIFQKTLYFNFQTYYQTANETGNPLLYFLRENNCENFASFLELFERDKKVSGTVEKLQPYRRYFDKYHPQYIDFPPDLINRFQEIIVNQYVPGKTNASHNEKIIFEAVRTLKTYFTRNLMPSFLFSYGALVLPVILKTEHSAKRERDFSKNPYVEKETRYLQSKLKRFPTSIQNFNIRSFFSKKSQSKCACPNISPNDSVLTFAFNIQGEKSQFRIEKIDIQNKKDKKEEKKDKEIEFNFDFSINDDKEEVSTVNLILLPITIFISTESFRPLVVFFESFNVKPAEIETEEEKMFSVEHYQKIMNCINYNKKTAVKSKNKKLDIRAVINTIDVHINNYRSHFIHERRLTLSFRDFALQLIDPGEIQEEVVLESDILETHYQKLLLDVGRFAVYESVYSNGAYNDIYLFKTKLSTRIYTCLLQNHPLYTDRKINVLIPYIHLNLDDNLVLLCELVQIYKRGTVFQTKKNSKAIVKSSVITMGDNQRAQLTNRLQLLLKDHRKGNQNCKHCILRYKKSSLVMNVFIGDLAQRYKVIEKTAFKDLVSIEEQQENAIGEALGLLVTMRHSLTLRPNPAVSTIFHLPFFVLTKDVGFFKENIAIHSSENGLSMQRNASIINSEKLEDDMFISKFKPLAKAERGCLSQLDENFWRYFMKLEETLTKPVERVEEEDIADDIPVLKRFITAPTYVLSQEIKEASLSFQPLYVLFLSKKNLRKEILKDLDYCFPQTDLNDVLIFRMKELSFSLGSLCSFSAVVNTLATFAQLNTWITHFLSSGESKVKQRQTEMPKPKFKQPEDYLTISKIKNILKNQNISFLIERITWTIDCEYPKNTIGLQIDKLAFENFYNHRSGMHSTIKFKKEPWNLFSIDTINLQTTSKGLGYIEKINLKFHEFENSFHFTVKKIYHNCPSHYSKNLISIPPVRVADKMFGATDQRAIDIELAFQNNLLTAVNVLILPIEIYLSQDDLIEGLSPIIVLKELYYQEKLKTEKALDQMVFEKNIFLKVAQGFEVIEKKPSGFVESCSTFGPFLAHEDTLLAIFLEKLTINFAKDHITFLTFDINAFKYEIDLNQDYRGEVDRFSLNPYDSYYKNMTVDMGKDKTTNIIFYKEDERPTIHVTNCKVIYLGRVLKEFMRFNKEVREQLNKNALETLKYDLDLCQEPMLTKPKPPPKESKSPFKMVFEDSCLVIPRNSKSKDAIVMLGKRSEVTIDKELRLVEVPSKIAKVIAIKEETHSARPDGLYEKLKTLVSKFHIFIEEHQTCYLIGKKFTKVGFSKQATINMITAVSRTTNDLWNFESIFESHFGDFILEANQANLEEIRLINRDNGAELSELYNLKSGNFHALKVTYSANDFQLGRTKTKHPGVIVREILENKEKKSKGEKLDSEKKEEGDVSIPFFELLTKHGL